jgi:hypothetical protein
MRNKNYLTKLILPSLLVGLVIATSVVPVSGQANISKHLAMLLEAGMVSRRKNGLQVYTTIDLDFQSIAQEAIESGLKEIEKRQKYPSSNAPSSLESSSSSSRFSGGYDSSSRFGATADPRRFGGDRGSSRFGDRGSSSRFSGGPDSSSRSSDSRGPSSNGYSGSPGNSSSSGSSGVSREEALKFTVKNCQKLNVTHIITSFKDLFGVKLDELVKTIQKREKRTYAD